jgi:HEAT repeat protein
VTPSLPQSVPAGTVETIDRIWSGGSGEASPWQAALAALWIAGVLVALLRAFAGYRAASAIAKRAVPFGGAGHALRVMITEEVETPALFGALKPVVLLPASAASWPAERLEAVLAHESAHAARRDGLIELAAQLAVALHWYNPIVRTAARRLRAERELACDERVLAAGIDRDRYAAALVAVARAAGRRPVALLAMARPAELERRVRRLLSGRRPAAGGGRLRLAGAAAALALFLPLAALTTPTTGVLAAGSVQPGGWPLSGLDDPLSERVPLPYEALAVRAAAVPATGPEAVTIARLQAHLGRKSRGYGDLVRERAIWALAEAEGGRLFEPLAAHLASDDWRLRAYAAWSLTETGDRRATALLVPLLADRVWRVRAMAAAGIAALGDPRAAAFMADALEDPAWQVRLAAIEFIERTGDRALLRRLRPLLQDPHTGTRLQAQRVLGHS